MASAELELPVKHHKKHKKHSKHRKPASGPSMEELRKERMRREEAEKARTEALLRKFHGTEEKEDNVEDIPGRLVFVYIHIALKETVNIIVCSWYMFLQV